MIRGGERALPVALTVLIGACTSLVGPVPSGSATVGFVNATSIPVAVHVNGTWVGTFPAWSERREIVVSGHGGPPWHVEFLGRDNLDTSVLADLEVDENAGSFGAWSSTCGQFVAWYGAVPDDLPRLDPDVRPANPPCR